MKLTTRLKNGRLRVNKEAVLKKLRKHRAANRVSDALRKVREMGLLPVTQPEIDAEFHEMTRYNADRLLET